MGTFIMTYSLYVVYIQILYSFRDLQQLFDKIDLWLYTPDNKIWGLDSYSNQHGYINIWYLYIYIHQSDVPH